MFTAVCHEPSIWSIHGSRWCVVLFSCFDVVNVDVVMSCCYSDGTNNDYATPLLLINYRFEHLMIDWTNTADTPIRSNRNGQRDGWTTSAIIRGNPMAPKCTLSLGHVTRRGPVESKRLDDKLNGWFGFHAVTSLDKCAIFQLHVSTPLLCEQLQVSFAQRQQLCW